jgi:hypothetical protein
MNIVKQIESLKCSVCGYYTAIFLMKDGQCKYCLTSPSKQEIAKEKTSNENENDNNHNV